jgi:hypothetical protein
MFFHLFMWPSSRFVADAAWRFALGRGVRVLGLHRRDVQQHDWYIPNCIFIFRRHATLRALGSSDGVQLSWRLNLLKLFAYQRDAVSMGESKRFFFQHNGGLCREHIWNLRAHHVFFARTQSREVNFVLQAIKHFRIDSLIQ